jgi:hypothetical protein
MISELLNNMADKTFLTKAKFSKMVEAACIEHRMSYIDTIVYLCDKNNIDLEDARKFISPTLKGKVEAEAQLLNFLPRSAALPLE